MPYQGRMMLWVRETWAAIWPDVDPAPLEECTIEYKADSGALYPGGWPADETSDDTPRWQSPIHMPRWMSRITLQITDVRVERLQDISRNDALAEGIEWVPGQRSSAILDYAALWDQLNAKRGHPWISNPFVWVITFKRLEAQHDQSN